MKRLAIVICLAVLWMPYFYPRKTPALFFATSLRRVKSSGAGFYGDIKILTNQDGDSSLQDQINALMRLAEETKGEREKIIAVHNAVNQLLTNGFAIADAFVRVGRALLDGYMTMSEAAQRLNEEFNKLGHPYRDNAEFRTYPIKWNGRRLEMSLRDLLLDMELGSMHPLHAVSELQKIYMSIEGGPLSDLGNFIAGLREGRLNIADIQKTVSQKISTIRHVQDEKGDNGLLPFYQMMQEQAEKMVQENFRPEQIIARLSLLYADLNSFTGFFKREAQHLRLKGRTIGPEAKAAVEEAAGAISELLKNDKFAYWNENWILSDLIEIMQSGILDPKEVGNALAIGYRPAGHFGTLLETIFALPAELIGALAEASGEIKNLYGVQSSQDFEIISAEAQAVQALKEAHKRFDIEIQEAFYFGRAGSPEPLFEVRGKIVRALAELAQDKPDTFKIENVIYFLATNIRYALKNVENYFDSLLDKGLIKVARDAKGGYKKEQYEAEKNKFQELYLRLVQIPALEAIARAKDKEGVAKRFLKQIGDNAKDEYSQKLKDKALELLKMYFGSN